MSVEPLPDQTTPLGASEGVGLVLAAQDDGNWKPVAEWLARHPEHAREVAEFMGRDERIPPRLAPRPAVRVGGALGDFELLEALGSGTTGVVYRARERVGAREVAVKVVRTAGLSAAELARARFEVQAMAELRHPNIVPLFTPGEDDGELYFAMPLMTAGTLEKYRKAQPDEWLMEKEAARLVREVALGVHHAHLRGLIHRDLKPANILLDADCKPHVADFGLARRTDELLTTVAGSPAYMSPEQARGERHLTPASDVHALGAILFELLTGRTPFRGKDVASVLRSVIEESAPQPRALHRAVSRDLQAICLKCLEKRPENRYASAQELADDLNRYLHGEPVKARPRGLLGAVRDAFGRPAEVRPFVTVPAIWFAVVHHPIVHLTVMTLLLAGEPEWAFGVMMYHLVAWITQVWWFHARRVRDLNEPEKLALVCHLGIWLAVVTLLPLYITYFGTNVLPLYPILNLVGAVFYFVLGGRFAGHNYALALLVFGQNLLLPFLPTWSWPLLHAVVILALYILFGLHLRRVHQNALAADQSTERSPPTS